MITQAVQRRMCSFVCLIAKRRKIKSLLKKSKPRVRLLAGSFFAVALSIKTWHKRGCCVQGHAGQLAAATLAQARRGRRQGPGCRESTRLGLGWITRDGVPGVSFSDSKPRVYSRGLFCEAQRRTHRTAAVKGGCPLVAHHGPRVSCVIFYGFCCFISLYFEEHGKASGFCCCFDFCCCP